MKFPAGSTPRCRKRDDPQHPIPAGILDGTSEEPAAEEVVGHQGPRSESRVQPPG